MVAFRNEQNQNILVSTQNYEFPASNDKEYDGNWLQVNIKIIDNQKMWETTAPFLLTYDWIQIGQWFSEAAQFKQPKWKDLSFIEPNIEFQLVDFNRIIDRINFNIQLRLECVPPFYEGNEKVQYRFCFTSKKCEEIAEMCKKEYERFPERR